MGMLEEISEKYGDAHVWITPARQFGSPCVGGTRIPTEVIADLFIADDSVEDICHDYDVTPQDVAVALWFERNYGTRRIQQRLQALGVEQDAVPLPSIADPGHATSAPRAV